MKNSNNNSAAVKRLSQRSLRSNKSRNIVALLAIVLTTFMITSVFSIGLSFAKNASVMLTRLSGTTASMTLNSPTDEQIETISALKGINSIGKEINAGGLRGKTIHNKNLSVSLLYCDESDWENQIKPAMGNIKGEYPTKHNEVMLSEKALNQLFDVMPSIGEKMTLTYKSNGETYTEDFILCGSFADYQETLSGGLMLVSEEFCRDRGLTVYDNGRICLDTQRRYDGAIYDGIKAVIREGQKYESSYSNSSNESTIGAIVVIVMITMFIVLSGYLLIYNIMYISVTKDINFYGLLKTIGTSPKQISTIVRRQGVFLSAIGIPVGIALGFALSFGIVPYAMSAFSEDNGSGAAMPADMSFNPLIFIGTAAFALLTVMLSCRKPAKHASRVSPVEAVRYTGVSNGGRKKDRKSSNGGKLYKMAFHNVFRDKKRAVLVFVSLFMGIITFLSVFSLFSSMKVENFISRYYPNDFQYQSIPPLDEEKFDAEFINNIVHGLEGIKSTELVNYANVTLDFDKALYESVMRSTYEIYKDEIGVNSFEEYSTYIENVSKNFGYTTNIFGVDDKYFELYNDTHEDKIDINAWRNGEICILNNENPGFYDSLQGKTMNFEFDGKNFSVKPVGMFEKSSDCDFGKYSYAIGTVQAIYMSREALNKIIPNARVCYFFIDVDKEFEPAIKAQLKKMNSELVNTSYRFEARSDEYIGFENSMRTIKVLTAGISLLLIFIGIINFVNVMMTGVFARRRELAVLESIGMTKKQIRIMLTLEGVMYALVTTTLVGTLGNLILYVISQSVNGLADYAKFEYPLTQILVVVVALFVVCFIVPSIVYKLTSKDTVTERLRNDQ